MQETILGAKQKQAIKMGLSIEDLLVLNYLRNVASSTRFDHIVENTIPYTHISYHTVNRDLPIAHFTEFTFNGLVENLINHTVIEKLTKHNKDYYALTEPAYDNLYMQPDEDDYVSNIKE